MARFVKVDRKVTADGLNILFRRKSLNVQRVKFRSIWGHNQKKSLGVSILG